MEEKIAAAIDKYALTPRESTVFRHFLIGHNAAEIAQLEGLTYETTRWYIKQIYQKTGTNRQSMLMRLLLG